MRTVTFSDPDVRNMLSSFFTCAWKNLEGDRGAGGSPRIKAGDAALPSMRGSGFSNVQLVVLTPDGRLLHSLSGFINAGDLRWELAQALITYETMLAHPNAERNAVVRRQRQIQRAFEGKKPTKRRGLFQLKGSSKKIALAANAPSRHARRHAKNDREVVRRHALKPAERLTTRQLVNERSGGDFSRDGTVIETGTRTNMSASWMPPPSPPRPMPWNDMSPTLRTRVGKALGVTPPKPAEKKKRRTAK